MLDRDDSGIAWAGPPAKWPVPIIRGLLAGDADCGFCLVRRNVGIDSGYLPGLDGHVHFPVDTVRHIDHVPAFENEIVSRSSAGRSGSRRQCARYCRCGKKFSLSHVRLLRQKSVSDLVRCVSLQTNSVSFCRETRFPVEIPALRHGSRPGPGLGPGQCASPYSVSRVTFIGAPVFSAPSRPRPRRGPSPGPGRRRMEFCDSNYLVAGCRHPVG